MYGNLHVTYNARNLACVITGHEISRVASLRIVDCRITRAHRCFISLYRCNVVNLNLVMARRRARTHLNNANIHIYILLHTNQKRFDFLINESAHTLGHICLKRNNYTFLVSISSSFLYNKILLSTKESFTLFFFILSLSNINNLLILV